MDTEAVITIVAVCVLAVIVLMGWLRTRASPFGAIKKKPSGGGFAWALLFLSGGRMPPPPPQSQIEEEAVQRKNRAVGRDQNE